MSLLFVLDSNANIPPQIFRPQQPNVSLGEVKRSQSGPIVIGAGKPIPYGNNLMVNKSMSQISKSSSMSSGFVSKVGAENGGSDGLADFERLEISPITSVEEFCPDGGQLTGFLDDVHFNTQNVAKEEEQSDSDTDTGNPLVSELQEDFEPDEQSFSKPIKFVKKQEAVYVAPLRIVKSDESSELDKTMPEEYDVKHDEFDSTINSEISDLTSDAYDAWMGADTKWRRSPEGGEDNSVVSQTLDYSNSTAYDDSTSITSSNVHMELLLVSKQSQSSNNLSVHSDSEETQTSSSVKKDKKKKDKTEKKLKKKSKDKDKTKESAKGDKKHKRRSRDETSSHRDELEEFLNGPAISPIDAAYEAI